MANVKIPESLNSLLQKDQNLDGIVKKTLSDFGEILKENNLFFFEEYTDHGLEHIQNVLHGSSKLVSDDTLEHILTSDDVAFYILSVVLHDIGMHLTLDGFKIFLSGEYDNLTPELSEVSWENLWQNYLSEAKRFSGKQLTSIFGHDDINIRNPLLLKAGELNGNDRKLVGEFIRRHHPRIAHEIAINGFPSLEKNKILFASELNEKQLDLIGFIARSHGMNLRKCVEFLEQKHGSSRRIPLGIHAAYLMILLRTSDYLQIDSSRVSKIIMKTKTFESPISELEHNSHLAIDFIDDKYQDDPERIYVSAAPKDSFMYLKLKKLFKSIQTEFDISWAVLGELYGNLENKPLIKFRRISSNLDDLNYIKEQTYIGDYISFKANDDITKLLIGPLYGNHPKYGIRELIQNSVDACNERSEIENFSLDYTAEINIEIIENSNGKFFIIRDNGKGMSLDEIKNYFLSAGASYRKSREWKEMFTDEKGNSKVQRNGRFGIGVLAAFLIGKSISIKTRKINSDFGYSFEANLNMDQINISKDDIINIGTLITIEIKEDVFEILNSKNKSYGDSILWTDWYTLSKPKLNISFLGNEIVTYENFDPHYLDSIIPNDWNYLDAEGYNKILWTYSDDYSGRDLVCNGIAIPIEDSRYDEKKIIDVGLFTKKPKISIFDNDGLTPLTLNRNNLSENLDFHEELKKSIYKDYIAYLLTFKNISIVKNKTIKIKDQSLSFPGVPHYYNSNTNKMGTQFGESNYYKGSHLLRETLISKKGYIVNNNFFINRLKPCNLVFIQTFNYQYLDEIHLDLKNNFLIISDDSSDSIDHYKSLIIKTFSYYEPNKNDSDSDLEEVFNSSDYNAHYYMKDKKYQFLFQSTKKRMPYWVNDILNENFKVEGWIALSVDKPTKSVINKEFLKANKQQFNFIREAPLSCDYEGDELLNSLLERYIGNDVIIPFDLKERKKKFPLAFKELKRYMEKYI